MRPGQAGSVHAAGLAGCLALLKDRGELNVQVEWAGRTTDIVAAQRLVQVRMLRCCLGCLQAFTVVRAWSAAVKLWL